jgi:hypothetical protein
LLNAPFIASQHFHADASALYGLADLRHVTEPLRD